MKLTLASGGGFTGLTKESSVDINSLDESTRNSLLHYIDKSSGAKPRNFSETWTLNDDKEVPIDNSKMNEELKELYNRMKKELGYRR